MTILLIIIIIIAIPFVMALFLSKEYIIQKEVVINKPVQDVFNFVRVLQNQEVYNKWVMTDPNAKRTTAGIDGTVGFIMAWDSENKQVGKGEQEITRIKEGNQLDYDVRFEKPFNGVAYCTFITSSVANGQTKLVWVFRGIRTYFMKVIHVLLNLKNALGKDMQTSLFTLKTVLEK